MKNTKSAKYYSKKKDKSQSTIKIIMSNLKRKYPEAIDISFVIKNDRITGIKFKKDFNSEFQVEMFTV